jgi:4'-phosphopantetheinyl transferase EntD
MFTGSTKIGFPHSRVIAPAPWRAERLETVFPPPVVLAVMTGPGPENALTAPERAIMGRLPAPRRSDFVNGRICARRALGVFLDQPPAVGRDSAGAPRWPAGFRGAIAHAHDVACAAACPSDALLGLGVDVEKATQLEPGLAQSLCTPEEIAGFPTRSEPEGAPWPLIAFAVKEAVFKATYPVFARFLELHEVSVTLLADSEGSRGAFRVDRLGQGLQALTAQLRGRWTVEAGFIFAGAELCAISPHAWRGQSANRKGSRYDD